MLSIEKVEAKVTIEFYVGEMHFENTIRITMIFLKNLIN